ncbi:hypothetical protein ONZ43_g7117 [Nemania bipapillata]|uniref:Uncharacterized protein n=1 Tax=Nemania bipapillata TaxID=110536 RepID=A0ACC2HT83_9PEZI|nr:hypothetical protein ONZ43_g7117 [Nemania bipapillata]
MSTLGSLDRAEDPSSQTGELRMAKTEVFTVRMGDMARRPDQEDRAEILRFDNRFLTAQHLRFYNMRISRIAFALIHPTAVTLELIQCHWDLTAKIPISDNIAASTIRLVGTQISSNGFNEILANFPRLRTLVYYRPEDEIDSHFDMVGTELRELGGNLEHLTMLNEAYMPFCTPIGSLQKLTNLKTLEIDLELLIGFRENPNEDYDEYMDSGFIDPDTSIDYEEIHEQAGDWCLVKMLPASLETLTLHLEDPKLDIYFYTYERYGAKLEELITADDLFPNLVSISAPRLSEVAEKLSGRDTAWVLTKSTMHRHPHPIKAEESVPPALILAEFSNRC